MPFEYDSAKSAANKIKHGIDFEAAQALWRDERLLEAPAKTEDEQRFVAIGKLEGKHWTAVYAHRDGNIRLISVRRARQKEIERYESEDI
ncbi:MAG: BrnT family toxin [Roseiarcus sp.]|jgi:uncharacterized DUF497 family protein